MIADMPNEPAHNIGWLRHRCNMTSQCWFSNITDILPHHHHYSMYVIASAIALEKPILFLYRFVFLNHHRLEGEM
jgi:hypothetical protein